MNKISTSTFYNHKYIYELNDFIDITKTTYDNTITINIGGVLIIVNDDTDLILEIDIYDAILNLKFNRIYTNYLKN